MKTLNVAIVGAAGVVGQETLRQLAARHFPVGEIRVLATSRSAGATVRFRHKDYVIEETTPECFDGIDLAFFSATTAASLELAPEAVRRGAVVIDKSNAFRMNPRVPLAVPEVNPGAMHNHEGIIASPNCSTIQLVVALKPLYDVAGIRRAIVATYQSVSGTGREAMDELRQQTGEILAGRAPARTVYPHQIAFNLLPHIDAFEANGYTGEEMKLVRETRKILGDDGLAITATAVRVPVYIGHSEAVVIETERKITAAGAREILSRTPGVVVVDNPASLEYPMPASAAGRDEVFVGRIREDLAFENGLSMWVVADNLRKGAATNAVQIAEYLLANGLVGR